jgi:hypothetical protein
MRIEYTRSASPIGIPYEAIDRPDGGRCHGFFDLRANPGQIESVPDNRPMGDIKARTETPFSNGAMLTTAEAARTPIRRKAQSVAVGLFCW